MSKISEIMTLIEFPREAADYFEEVFAKVEGDKELMSQLEALEAQYFDAKCITKKAIQTNFLPTT